MKGISLLVLSLLLTINFGSCWRRRRRRSPPPPPPRVNGGWSGWGPFGGCTKACGTGTMTQYRQCNNPAPANGGSYCPGSSSHTIHCNTHPCIINGAWSAWGAYGLCSKSCGGGTQSRSRQCTNPAPAHGGRYCPGASSDSRSCNTQMCPVDGAWSTWGAFGACSKSCGGGSRSRNRQCTNPSPAHGGSLCSGASSESKSCNAHFCPDGPNSAVLTSPGGTKYQMVGCFSNQNNLLTELLITERDSSSEKWNNIFIDWKNWNNYMKAFISRCVNETVADNYNLFGMSYYGECWSNPGVDNALELYTKDLKDFSKCVTDDYHPCNPGNTRCVGKNDGLALYQIIEN